MTKPEFFRKNLDYGEREAMEKDAIIRGEGIRVCPFGLPVTDGCKCVGKSIHRLAPLSSVDNDVSKTKLSKANQLVFLYTKEKKQCPYASKIIEEFKKVDCNFGDTAAGMNVPEIKGSPIYPSTFSGVSLDRLCSFPLGYYADNSESRNLFFGLFSLLGSNKSEDMIKVAGTQCLPDKTDDIDSLLNYMKELKEKYKDAFEVLEKHLLDYKEKYEGERADGNLLWQLAEKWLKHI